MRGGARKRIRPAREIIPATGKKSPPLSAMLVAIRLALLAEDSMMEASIIMLGAWAARVLAVYRGTKMMHKM